MVKCEICGSSEFDDWYSGGVVRGNWEKGCGEAPILIASLIEGAA